MTFFAVEFLLSRSTTESRRFSPAISIPGFGSGRQEERDIASKKKPPPPPPRGFIGGATSVGERPPPPPKTELDEIAAREASDMKESLQREQFHAEKPDPNLNPGQQPRQPFHWGQTSFLPPPPTGWIPPTQQQQAPESPWDQQQLTPYQGMNDFEVLRRELDDSLFREAELLGKIDNLTNVISNHVAREDLHMRQLDVLTERVMDTEALVSSEHNALLEVQANCTELIRSMGLMKEEVEAWEAKCANLTSQHEIDLKALEEMKEIVAQREQETEELATAIERARLEDERERLLVEERKRKKRRGFWAWLFGLTEEEDEEESLRAAQELARNTLLRALKTERNSVHELEAMLTTLQLNNSAISEMVESRDSLIQELNDRVAVFEEDKVVLKAALRQLQKEIKDEAPKTQKLVDDLRDARFQVQSLNQEIQALNISHQNQIELMEEILFQKQAAINQTESNLTMIGTYVDKLEERLASFAIARRDIEIREGKCQAIEARAIEMERERDSMAEKLATYESEHDELKALLDDLATERATLQQQMAALVQEKESLIHEGQVLRETIASLEIDVDGLNETVRQWKETTTELEKTVKDQQTHLTTLAENEDRHTMEQTALQTERNNLNAALETLESDRSALSFEQQQLEVAKAEVEAEQIRIAALKMELHFEKQKLANLKKESLPPPPPPLLPQITATSTVAPPKEELRVGPQLPDLHGRINQTEVIESSECLNETSNETMPAVRHEEIPNNVTQPIERQPQSTTAQGDESRVESLRVDSVDEVLPSPGEDELLVSTNATTQIENRSFGAMDVGDSTGGGRFLTEACDVEVTSNSTLTATDSPPPLPLDNETVPNTTVTRPLKQSGTAKKGVSRKVPLRKLRKSLSKATGIHGLITPSTRQLAIRAHRRATKHQRQEDRRREKMKKKDGVFSTLIQQERKLAQPQKVIGDSTHTKDVLSMDPPPLPDPIHQQRSPLPSRTKDSKGSSGEEGQSPFAFLNKPNPRYAEPSAKRKKDAGRFNFFSGSR